MSGPLSLLLGFLLGSVPTADWIARIGGIDLRGAGTGNPGAANARQLGGTSLAVAVLTAEMTKGLAAVLAGAALAGTAGAALAGTGAVAGNVFNPWHRFHGGQGLGIAAGVLLAAWPAGLVAGLVPLLLATWLSKTSRVGALTAAVALAVAGTVETGWSRWGWGIEGGHLLLALGVAIVVATKQVLLLLGGPLTPPSNRRSSPG